MNEADRIKNAIDLSASENEPWVIYFELQRQIYEAKEQGIIPWDVAGELQSRLEIAWETGHDDEMERRMEGC